MDDLVGSTAGLVLRLLLMLLAITIRLKTRAIRALSSYASRGVVQKDGSSLISKLSNPSLLAKVWDVKAGDDSFPVYNPAQTDQIIAHVPNQSDHDIISSYIARASDALPTWRDGTTAAARGDVLREWSRNIGHNAQDLATIITMESGKPLQESLAEVAYARSFLDYYAAEAVRPQGFTVPTPFVSNTSATPRGQILVTQHAVGVTGLITPWNFPLAMIARKVAPALAAGCTALVKPSELTPLSAIALQALLPTTSRSSIPDIVQTITSDGNHCAQVGKILCTHSSIKKLSFTGSTRVGRQLMEWSSHTIQRLSLELGGNAPFIVCDDASLDQAVTAAMASKFRNAGQTCVSADRFLVHAKVQHDFVAELCRRIQTDLKVGPGLNETCNLGPLITTSARKAVETKVQAAIAEGATLQLGGNARFDLGANFFEPTVLTDVSPESDIWKTETFGPVVAIQSFTTEDECIRMANDSSAGLAAYVCTTNLARSLRLTQRIDCGIIGVNEGIISTCCAPFGGVKESGLGREGSPLGLQDYLETKYIFLNTD